MKPITLALLIGYTALLFGVAWWGEKALQHPTRRFRSIVYGLSLAVYCTSWTYFGAVGTASRTGWDYLPIFLGPSLAIVGLFPIWRRVATAAHRQNAGSLADFLASRYGKSQMLGAIVTLIAIAGVLPYIALQLKSLATSWDLISGQPAVSATSHLRVFVSAAILCGFAILFGARRSDLTEHNRGLIRAISFEALVKLFALVTVAVIALWLLSNFTPAQRAAAFAATPLAHGPELGARFFTLTALSTVAIFCLPRQFHVGFVEGGEEGDLRWARLLFPFYLGITSLCVIPIAIAGSQIAAHADPDFLLLLVPRHVGAPFLQSLAFVGGFSASTAMVIMEAVALAAMVSNHLVLPTMSMIGRRWSEDTEDYSQHIIQVRRMVIAGLLALACGYYFALDRTADLASIGITSFAASAQLAPAFFGGLFWRRGHANGAAAGAVAGMLVWFFCLARPQFGTAWWHGGLGLPPGGVDPIVFGAAVSLSINAALYVVVSLLSPEKLIDRVQAAAFLDTGGGQGDARAIAGATIGDLRRVLTQFLGKARAERGLRRIAQERGVSIRPEAAAEVATIRAAERLLAGAIGPSLSRRVISAALAQGEHPPSHVLRTLDEAAQAARFSFSLLEAALNNIDQGVSVVDRDLRLVAWNERYSELFTVEPGFLYVGQPIGEVIAYNARRSECTAEGLDAVVAKRLGYFTRWVPHAHEGVRANGRVLKAVGKPLASGFYITSFSDITELRRSAQALEAANETLEARVTERTQQLAAAKADAERATASKTRFLAAASHDLLQPLHAARLFLGALAEMAETGDRRGRKLIADADRSIGSAHGLLRALLNLSRLEAGGVKPEVTPISIGELFLELEREFLPQAGEKGLRLAFVPTDADVLSDRDLLRSMLQNLISNAIRYTDRGRVLIGCRRRGKFVRVEVWDTGTGVAETDWEAIFEDFVRLRRIDNHVGSGLGLAIVKRVADLLNVPIYFRSLLGRGSVFGLSLPIAPRRQMSVPENRMSSLSLEGLRVLCVDDDPNIVEGLAQLLRAWGVEVTAALNAEDALAMCETWDAALVDYKLGGDLTGLDLIRLLAGRTYLNLLITAEADSALALRAAELNVRLLEKPTDPLILRAALSTAMKSRVGGAPRERPAAIAGAVR